MKIERKIHQVWIGPLPTPTKWMKSWGEKNPDWKYVLWDNKKIFSRKWKNQHLIDECLRKYEKEVKGKNDDGRDVFISAKGSVFKGDKATAFAWHIIADIVRYEILYEYGGYMPGADSECLKSIEERFEDDPEIYLVNTGHMYKEKYEELCAKLGNKKPRGKDKISFYRWDPHNCAPVAACTKKNKWVGELIKELGKLKPKDVKEAVDTTGNVLMGKMIRKNPPKNARYVYYQKKADGSGSTDQGLSRHHAGTTKGCYHKGREINDVVYLYDGKSRWNERDLIWSIRSLMESFEFGQLVVVGTPPNRIKPDLMIKIADMGYRTDNVIQKILGACHDERVSENFLLMNDDFYFLKKQDITVYTLPYFHYKNKSDEFMKRWRRVQKDLAGKKNYEVHYPMMINKKKFIDLFQPMKEKIVCWRSFYGNHYEIPSKEITEDFKFYDDDDFFRKKDKDFISSPSGVKACIGFKNFIRDKYKIPSRYEVT